MVQCDACGTLRPVPPASPEEETDQLAAAATRLLSQFPAMSSNNARRGLEEMLYEHRSAIEGSPAFCEAMTQAQAAGCEMQDIKVQRHNWEQTALFVAFTYYALGERDADQAARAFRVDGTGSARIDRQGKIEFSDVTATVAEN